MAAPWRWPAWPLARRPEPRRGSQEGLLRLPGSLDRLLGAPVTRRSSTTLQKNGVEVVELNGGKDANRQLEQIKDCIAQGADGIILTADDGDSETMLVALAQEADVPIATFNRPPSDHRQGHHRRRRQRVGRPPGGRGDGGRRPTAKFEGDRQEAASADPGRRPRRPERGEAPRRLHECRSRTIRTSSRRRSRSTPSGTREVALAGLEAAITADPNIDFIFTSSDFLFPTIQGVLEATGKWKKTGEEGHVILGGLDGDDGACKLIREGYVDSTGVQDVYLEAKLALDGILDAIAKGETRPNAVKLDPGFALSQANYAEKGAKTWGCLVLDAKIGYRPAWRAGMRSTRPALGFVVHRRASLGGTRPWQMSLVSSAAWRAGGEGGSAGGRRLAACRLRAPPAPLRILHPLSDHRLFRRHGGLLPRPRQPPQHQQPALQRLAAARRRDRPDLRHHHRRHRPSARAPSWASSASPARS